MISAIRISCLTADLALFTKSLTDTISADPASVATLIPSGLAELDDTLRQVALVLSTLGMASQAITEGFPFNPTPNPEASHRLVILAAEYAETL